MSYLGIVKPNEQPVPGGNAPDRWWRGAVEVSNVPRVLAITQLVAGDGSRTRRSGIMPRHGLAWTRQGKRPSKTNTISPPADNLTYIDVYRGTSIRRRFCSRPRLRSRATNHTAFRLQFKFSNRRQLDHLDDLESSTSIRFSKPLQSATNRDLVSQ